ncbi:uncharacterized protein LOC128011379 [Carassius gibelio]|uniref:uncharacterized protein LOC128011378 n=1 Tax=Carassius gibelio TaxID=101364 RepID=UPI002277DD4C|nr:uncharacterized protein LOC128011377 isoform X1 [Carassius gibelio]XP_052449670.1 uncharacterized protein LOC128011377 isoform X2 [Carassius gibelio]XP_052449671.1 uncharacterized protein LOC128011377 isoform X3 [Carassius gibelio]XP_052449673.1 uncharacterized protein LOC128011377 isoform X4 [Carassius gibelio]XP_052449674.1 uncharacterized protein LOC128011377 isoform X5 [Carassius gibelio]XP_052449675.1 uncharacterized protein LOC128011378 [Carassius gibelio]XP_052449676.1 uncharacteriz
MPHTFLTLLLMALTISTINVRSVRSTIRAQSILSFLKSFKSDLFLLQECSLPFLTRYTKMEELWSAGASIWSGSNFNKNDGVAVLINNPNILVKGSTVVSPPRWFLGKLERAVFYFLWGSKWERLKRETIKKRPENGGKGLPDPHLFLGSRFTALHISYATTPSKENKTAAMARFWMGSYLRTLKILPVDLKTPVSFNLPKETGNR